MQCWLMKSEPDEFSLADLQKRRREPWTGVRNYQARNFMRAAKQGDVVLFYHSNCTEPGIVGLAEVTQTAFTDPTQFDKKSDYYDAKSTADNPRWSCVEVGYVETFRRLVSLEDLRQSPALKSLLILRPGNRLSVTPVTAQEFREIKKLGSRK
ncbi:EVE domain-containing protein [bacterium]|nr:EVE domain-containing protein [bacterium]